MIIPVGLNLQKYAHRQVERRAAGAFVHEKLLGIFSGPKLLISKLTAYPRLFSCAAPSPLRQLASRPFLSPRIPSGGLGYFP